MTWLPVSERKVEHFSFLSKRQVYCEVYTQNQGSSFEDSRLSNRRDLMKKIVLSFVLVVFIATLLVTSSFAGSQLIQVNASDSTVVVNYDTTDYSLFKVGITKDSNTYYYSLTSSEEVYPLQMGNGNYSVTLYKNISGNSYKSVSSERFNLSSSVNSVFLASSQNIKWDTDSMAVKFAENLTETLDTDEEKFNAIYDYVVNNISYDYRKAYNVKPGYIPTPDEILSTGKGICYDYSSLLAVMLRSQDIPTKLVMGSSTHTSAYHAWNEVFINGEWSTVDTTFDASVYQPNSLTSFAKDTSDYDAQKFY
jgi:transglutaminase-like putative cysteine protease